MERIEKARELMARAFTKLASMKLDGDNVDIMAQAKTQLRLADMELVRHENEAAEAAKADAAETPETAEA